METLTHPEVRVLQVLDESPPLDRYQLGSAAGLPPDAVDTALERLSRDGYLEQIDRDDDSPSRFRVRPDALRSLLTAAA